MNDGERARKDATHLMHVMWNLTFKLLSLLA